MSRRAEGFELGCAQVSAIALNTFREAVRSRIFYILMAFAVAMILCSSVMGLLTVGSRSRIIMDLGITTISFFSVMTSIFVGIGLIYQEIEKKTIYNILSKPLGRGRFIIGRYAGLMAVLAVNLAAMVSLLGLVLLAFGGFNWKIFVAGGFIYMQLAILTAIALFFSSVTSPVVSAICTSAFYIAGRTSSTIPEVIIPKMANPAIKKAAIWLYHLLPDLTLLDVSNLLPYDIPIVKGFPVRAVAYTVSYVGVLLILSCAAFRRRDLV